MKFKVSFFAMACALCVASVNSLLAQNNDNLAKYIANAPFKMPVVTEPQFKTAVFNIKDYGAIGDGQALNTLAIEKAIKACSAAGGGIVVIPAGLWLTGPIELKSNVNFHADRGALVTFTTDHTQYPMIDGKTKILLSGNKLENVGVTGEGVFDGGGDTWRPLKKSKAAPQLWSDLQKSGELLSSDGNTLWPTKQAMEGEAYLKIIKGKSGLTDADYLPARDFLRPTMVSITNSKNVLFDGPTFKNSPQFALNPKNCTNMIIRNVTINNEYYAQNGDGIDLSSCKNAVVYHCTVNAGDDGICMKSSGNKGDPNTDPGLTNIIIADCIVYHAHGGFVIGSNTDGGMSNVYVTNCNFVNTDVGIRIKSSRGRGGLVHNIYIDNVFMHDILNEAISFNTYYEDTQKNATATAMPVTAQTPRFQDFYISHVYCNNAKTAIAITGLPEMPVNHIYLSDITISSRESFNATDAADISLKNTSLISPASTLIELNNAQNITVDNMKFSKGVTTFISATGPNTQKIKVSKTDLKNLAVPVKLDKQLDKGTVLIQ